MHKIFIFSSVHRYNDTRVLHKEAVSLTKKYEVELHAPAPFKIKVIKNVSIIGLPQWKSISDRKNIRKIIWQRIKESNAKIFHFHDPELIWIALKTTLLLRKKVIYDIHEDHSKAILSKVWIPNYLKYFISKSFLIFEKFAAYFLENVIYTTTLIGDKINVKNKIPIYNYPFKSELTNKNITKNNNLIIYVGGITKIRGFNQILDALDILNNKGLNFHFNVIGPIQHLEYEKEIKNKIINYKLENKITLIGLLPYSEIFKYIEKAIVGLLCYLPEPNHLVTFPNKIFEYISMGTPVIASNFPLYKEIITKAKCGMLVDPLNPTDIANKIQLSLESKDEMKKLGTNGKLAILENYNWEMEEIKLLEFYNKIIGTINEN